MIGAVTRTPLGTVTNIKGKSPEVVLALGDYSYSDTAKCWLDRIADIKSKTHINIGNHENDANEGFSQYMNAFGNPTPPLTNQYYSFNYQNVHVLTMATEISFNSGSTQYNFVKNDLQASIPEFKHKMDYSKFSSGHVYISKYLFCFDLQRQQLA